MGSQTLELKWANHKSNMTSELQELYLSDALLDVTIACGEFSMKAHKTVLSASSTFFRKLFIDNPCKHPILIMTDVDYEDLKTIVEFMYQGEIHISREKLTQFLKTADRLKIKGLTSIEDMNLNPSEQSELEVDPQYSSGAWDNSSIQPQLQDSTPAENVQSSPRKLIDIPSDTNQDIQTIKLEDDLSHPDKNSCMYWQSDCFDQTSSSSVLPDCNLPSPSVSHQLSSSSASHKLPTQSGSHQLTSAVSHQLPAAPVSHQLATAPVSHQLSAPSVSHQLSNPTVSHQVANPVSHQLGVPSSSERFAFSESQSDSGTLTQVQEESTGRDIIPVNLYQSQDQSALAIPSSSKSFDVVESLSSPSSSQGGKTERGDFTDAREPFIIGAVSYSQGNKDVHEDLKKRKYGASIFSCSSCKKSFARRDMFEKHLDLHSTLNEFICTLCNYRFPNKGSLERHEKAHTAEKPFECQLCRKQFSQLSGLQSHERIHTGEKPFSCKICHKQFSWKNVLQCHERIHTGEKPYSCSVCLRQFAQLSTLQRHKRTHTGEKPFECHYCHKRFTTNSSLKQHEALHCEQRHFEM